MTIRYLLLLLLFSFVVGKSAAAKFSSKLIHRFSEEMRAVRVSRTGNASAVWPEKPSVEYYQMLMSSDSARQKMKFGSKSQLLFPSEGSTNVELGNNFGWLHYSWIDIGTPKVSFLVALDSGSDLLWVPCECLQCAPLSSINYDSLVLPFVWGMYCAGYRFEYIVPRTDRDLNAYSPSNSSTSKYVSCSHQLCDTSANCQSSKQHCPYTVNYLSGDASSGFYVEDTLHLASGSHHEQNASAARVIFGCGVKQSGELFEGTIPDGVMGLGPGEAAVPSFLAKAELVSNSFSICFAEDDSGRIYFGDEGPVMQKYTPFLSLDGKYSFYVVGIEACCVGNSCLNQTSLKVLIDSGSSFTYLPQEVYNKIIQEFTRRVNAKIVSLKPFDYCFESSADKIPTLKLIFPSDNSFVVHNPVQVFNTQGGDSVFCLTLLPTDDTIGVLGQNFMGGYRLVFDREKMKLGWSISKCQDLVDDQKFPDTAPNGSSAANLPANEHQISQGGHAVSPAVAGRTPKPSTASSLHAPSWFHMLKLGILLNSLLLPL